MLSFIKPKKILKDLIPDHSVDIHSHLLWGIDDGAKTSENTLSLIESLQDIGFSQFITTPHILPGVWNNTHQDILTKEIEVKEFIASNNKQIPLKAAAEYMLDMNLVDLMKKERLLTLKDNYVLVEMSYINPPIQLFDILFELQVEGYKPILAHPERYLFYHQKPEAYLALSKAGCLFQLNLLSTTGYYGESVLKCTKQLLEKGLIQFVGSDTHHQNHIKSFNNKVLLKKTAPLEEAIQNNKIFIF